MTGGRAGAECRAGVPSSTVSHPRWRGPQRCPARRHASGAGAADAPLRRRSLSTAYGSQRQPPRWSGSPEGRPPVKMAARPVVTWSKRAGSSPSMSTAPVPLSFPPDPCSRRRRGPVPVAAGADRGARPVRHERSAVLDAYGAGPVCGVSGAHLLTTRLESRPHRACGSAWVGMRGQPVSPPRRARLPGLRLPWHRSSAKRELRLPRRRGR